MTVRVDDTRFSGIDVLRGLSVLLVVLHHIHIRFHLSGFETLTWLPRWVQRVAFWSGYYSVITFFVISGFLITRLSIARWGHLGRIPLREFYALRFSRLGPCLLALLLLLTGLHLAAVENFQIDSARVSLGRALVAALGFHVNWLEARHGYLPGNWDVLWSLSVEETFYFLFPLISVTLKSERLLLVPLLSLLVLGPWNRTRLMGQSPWDDYAYLSCMDGIAFGCLAALTVARLRLSASLRWAALALGAAAVVLVVVYRKETAALGLTQFGLNVTLLELGVALMLIAFGTGTGNALAAHGTQLLRGIGRASYEIYLTHMFVVLVVVSVFKRTANDAAQAPIWYAGMLVGSAFLGLLVWRFFSEPASRALRSRWLRPAGDRH